MMGAPRRITRQNADDWAGRTFVLFGHTYTVEWVEPQSDWRWSVQAYTTVDGEMVNVTLVVPSLELTN